MIMILAALITPSTDAFSMLIVVVPLWILYESSRAVVKKVERKKAKEEEV